MTDDADLANALGDLARFGAEARADGEAVSRGRAEFIERASAEKGRRGFLAAMSGLRLVPIGAAVATVALLGFFVLRRHHAPIDFSVEGALQSSGGFIQASADHDAVVKFSDGSTVDLSPGATGRVNALRDRGARFSVERGDVTVHVTKREGGADYDLDAGPYGVHVTGTKFELGWDPRTETMMLELDEGSVVVSGPHAEAGVGLRAGQTLRASIREGVVITETPAGASAQVGARASSFAAGGGLNPHDSVDVQRPSGASADTSPNASGSSLAIADATTPDAANSAKAQAEAPKRVSWSERVAKGDFASVLADADNRGIETTTSSAPLDDLMALADAARYGGRGAVSAQALRAVRQRFAGSKPASTAAFLLGRMAEDGGNGASAVQLYDATISEGGTFAGEALGRKMLLVKASSGASGARAIAEQYLQIYPKGPYAEAAKSIEAQ